MQGLGRQLAERRPVARRELAQMPEAMGDGAGLHAAPSRAGAQLPAHRPETQDPAIAMRTHAADGLRRTLKGPDRHARPLGHFGGLEPDRQIVPDQSFHVADDPQIALRRGVHGPAVHAGLDGAVDRAEQRLFDSRSRRRLVQEVRIIGGGFKRCGEQALQGGEDVRCRTQQMIAIQPRPGLARRRREVDDTDQTADRLIDQAIGRALQNDDRTPDRLPVDAGRGHMIHRHHHGGGMRQLITANDPREGPHQRQAQGRQS